MKYLVALALVLTVLATVRANAVGVGKRGYITPHKKNVQMPAPVECNRQRIVHCALHFMDKNADNALNATELDNFFTQEPCGHTLTQLNSTTVLSACDKNSDGVLTVADYDAPGSCFAFDAIKAVLCGMCARCEMTFHETVNKKK